MITTVPISIAALSASITRTHNRACSGPQRLSVTSCVWRGTCHELTEAMASQLDAELAKSAQRVITHMNNDHEPSLVAWARFYAKLDAKAARMSGLTSSGFELDVTLADGSERKAVLIPHKPPLESAAQVRKVAVALHFEAFNGLGVSYKLWNGFYQDAARQAWAHMPRRARVAVVAMVAAVAAAVALRLRR